MSAVEFMCSCRHASPYLQRQCDKVTRHTAWTHLTISCCAVSCCAVSFCAVSCCAVSCCAVSCCAVQERVVTRTRDATGQLITEEHHAGTVTHNLTFTNSTNMSLNTQCHCCVHHECKLLSWACHCNRMLSASPSSDMCRHNATSSALSILSAWN
jgi:hypothetical protein